jgi:polynucleotide 5'-hydroxyl-kinase GRC3/NOL9
MPASVVIQPGEKWEYILDKFSETGGLLITLGESDTGKSTFNRWLCNRLAIGGKTPAIVDCDMGQSDIGPPSTIGLALVKTPFENFADLKIDGLWFTGSIKPSGHFLQGLTGAVRLTSKAHEMGASHIIVNTTGWIEGSGIFYKQHKIDALRPSIIAAFEHDRELYPVTAPYRKTDEMSAVYLKPSPAVRLRKSDERRQLRKEKFDRYFQNAKLIAISTAKVGISGYGFFPEEARLVNQVIALIDTKGDHRAIGTVKKFNSKTKTLEIAADFSDNPSMIRRLHFENFRLNEEGDDYSG